MRGRRGRGLDDTICFRISNVERTFLEIISKRTGLSLSDSARLGLALFRIVLGLEAIDEEKLSKGFSQILSKVEDKDVIIALKYLLGVGGEENEQ